ncbi:PLxRFG domain-containing protein [Aquabacterium sp.]|uniref:PLxRFG domain-containing protein n=1 Tax=Aquabacterium sp. TaxID=1872578 RepID=UPI00248A887F|nr:PLxRFG domain-containing protein [Aquabacterium sp.]MDI1347908.1 PLxRFG domain-containing protein [Aquabacterium sp.]
MTSWTCAWLANGGHWSDQDVFSPTGMVQRLKNYADRLPSHAADIRAEMAKQAQEATAMREQAAQPFGQEQDLAAAREAHKKVQRALMAKGPAVPESQKSMVRDAMDAQKLRLRELDFGDALDEFMGSDRAINFAAQDDQDGYTPGNEKAQVHTQQRTERAARNMRRFQNGVFRYLRKHGRDFADDIDYFVPVDVPQAREIREIASAFGTEVQWFDLKEGLTKEQRRLFGQFRGANQKGLQFIRATDPGRPHLAVLGHELAHQMRADNEDLYNEFVDAVNAYIKPGPYKEFLKTDIAKEAADPREEFSGEVLSDLFMERDFWVNLGERSPTLLGRVADMVTRLVEKIMHSVGYTKRSAPYLTDFNKVMEIAADVMTRYAGQKMKAADEDGGDINAMVQGDDPAQQGLVRRVQNNLIQFFGNRGGSLKTFSLFDRTLATQYHKALKDKHFGKVFALTNAMQNHVSLASIRPAELAPGVLPRVDDVKSAVRTLVKGSTSAKPLEAAANAIFAGTLAGSNVLAGRVWTEAQLRAKFGLDDTGVALYQQARASIDASLDEVSAAEAYALAQSVVPKTMRREVIDHPQAAEGLLMRELDSQIKLAKLALRAAKKTDDEQRVSEMEALVASYVETQRNVEKVFATAKNLKKAGYAPLMRFGKYQVRVTHMDLVTGNAMRDDNGEVMTEFMGRYETQAEARQVHQMMVDEFGDGPDISITIGPVAQSAHELYGGISPETIALFADALGAEPVMRKYIEEALSERSALKRRLERKGTAGYSQDLPRVLSTFVTSNGRFAAQRYYLREINQAIKYIPKNTKGDVLDEALSLKKFILDPKDPAAPVSSLMFAWFLGGSVAAAVINLSQPFMMTGPYLAQHGVKNASVAMAKALPMAMGKKEIKDAALRAALKRASQEGIVDAQEIFHLYSVGAQGVASKLASALAVLPGVSKGIKAGSDAARARINAFMTLWGSMFSLAEGFNRKLTFIAAWEIAKGKGLDDQAAFAFSVRAVNETQGVYNKVNRSNFARSGAGRLVMTFKQFSIMYVELLTRMVKHGGPEGRRAALIMLAVLMLASGEEGLPFMQDLNDLIDTIGQGVFKLDTNTVRSKRRWAHETLGKELGDLFLYGVSAHLPVDIANRVGLGNLIPGTSLFKASDESQRGRQISELLGPGAGLGAQVGDAWDAAVEGNTGKAWANLSPKAVKDALASVEMLDKGYATDARGNKVTDVGPLDAAGKAIGFNPTKVAQEHRKTMPVQQDIALQKSTEASIVGQWARALVDEDDKAVATAKKRLEDWNRRNPNTPIVVKPSQLRNRVRQMNTEKEGRVLKMAPKEMRGQVGLDLADE